MIGFTGSAGNGLGEHVGGGAGQALMLWRCRLGMMLKRFVFVPYIPIQYSIERGEILQCLLLLYLEDSCVKVSSYYDEKERYGEQMFVLQWIAQRYFMSCF